MAMRSLMLTKRLLRTLVAVELSIATTSGIAAGTLEPWNLRTVEPRNPGTLEPWNLGTFETTRLTRTLTIAPDLPITIEASVGDIVVTGWDRPDVAIDIVQRAPTAALLSTLVPVIEQSEGGLAIKALQGTGAFDRAIRSTIHVNLPVASTLKLVSVLDGHITLSNLHAAVSAICHDGSIAASRLSGSIRLETLTGDIELEAATLSPTGLIRLRTFNGQVKLQLARRPENARILAVTFNGTITSDIPLTMKDRFGPRFGEATLGTGMPVVSIDVVTGNVVIKAPGGR